VTRIEIESSIPIEESQRGKLDVATFDVSEITKEALVLI